MNQCAVCQVRNQAICGALMPAELEAMSRIGRKVDMRRGETLIWEGDEAILVANVIDGVLKLSTSTEDGREMIVGMVYPADFIGRPFGHSNAHDVTAVTDARICVFPRSGFDSFARSHPELEHKLLERTLAELDRARDWMLLLARKSASEKVATLLLELSQRLAGHHEGTAASDNFALPFSRQQMADLLGLTIETVSRQLTQMRRAGIVDLPDRRTVHVLDRPALHATAHKQNSRILSKKG